MTVDTLWWTIDLLLVALVLGLSWITLTTASRQRAVILFMALGLLLALIWARLRAPDLALAEAAIGAGLAGALMLAALRDTRGQSQEADVTPGQAATLGAVTLLLLPLLGWAVWPVLQAGPPSVTVDQVFDQLPNTGVGNPVTAVLLNYRAYDTLLEIVVLLCAALGILALGPGRPAYHPSSPVLHNLLGTLVPLLVVIAGYLLWRGAQAPGGAFQGGAVLAAAWILLRLAGIDQAMMPSASLRRILLVLGPALFVGVGLGCVVAGAVFLQYGITLAGPLILLIEVAAMITIAAVLALAFVGGEPTPPTASSTHPSGGQAP